MQLSFSVEWFPSGPPAPIEDGVSRGTILALQEAAEQELAPEDRMPIDERTGHYFAPGLYCREFRLKAGEWVIGKIHKHAHLITLVHGDVDIADEFATVRIHGPKTWVSTPGVKRVVYAHTDTLFLTFHPTEETDLERIEDHVIAPDYAALDAFLNTQALLLGGEKST